MTISFSTLSILLPAAIMFHVTEEFLFPGGFSEWYAKLVPPKTTTGGIKYGYLVWINTFMMYACILPLFFGETNHGISIWFAVSAIAAMNACFHIWGVLKLKKYSPGVITGVLFYIPLFIIGGIQLISSGDLSLTKAIVFTAVGVAYHIFSVFRQGK
ncbi:uncharacterized protein with HXXEE motif [Flavobacterium sp. 270]|uniref:HXXEE domain-containing protein n=1 Tax=Flavobacterium sp. 270 TaxID=2512114 RepID=UPI001065D58E|nr:HXXEE domain-containing protein [Flavobacterium sp. 270]TDW49162.1 uncharacterized protein with HXXEE motif [Flavobacterium sp. 270]